MFRIFFYFLIVAMSAVNLNAQEWAKSFGNTSYDDAIDMVIDASGNSYTVGSYRDSIQFGNGISLISPGVERSFVAKFNSEGICQWAQSISSISNWSRPSCVALDSTGNIYVGGAYKDSTYFGNGIFLPKVDSISNGRDPYIVKYNSNGECQWAKSLVARSDSDRLLGIAIDAKGNAYVFGRYSTELTSNDGISLTSAKGLENFIAKYSPDGVCKWANRIGGLVGQYSEKYILSDSEGNLYIAGSFGDSLNFGNNISLIASAKGDGVLAKYNSSGVCQWAKAITGSDATEVISMSLDASGHLYLLGRYSGLVSINDDITLTSNGTSKRFIAKYNPEGGCLWAKNIGGSDLLPNQIYPNQIYTDSVGNNYIAGLFYGTAMIADGVSFTSIGKSDFFVAKYDTFGNFLWGQSICENGNYKEISGISADKESKVYLFGEYDGGMLLGNGLSLVSKGSYDCFLAKLDSKSRTYPSLKYPEYKAQTMSTNTHIEWNSAKAATDYRVQVSTFANFSTKLVDEVVTKNTTSRILNDLKYNTQYYWRVQTLTNNDTSAWSPIWNFSTGYDPNAQVWAQSFISGDSFFNQIDLAIDSSNNYYIVGDYDGSAYLGNGKYLNTGNKYTGFVSKYNSSSMPDWSSSQYSAKTSRTFRVATDTKGNIYITGYYSDTVSMGNNITLTSTGGEDGYFAKYTSAGECLWAKSIGSVSDDYVVNLLIDKNEDIYVFGYYSDTISLGNNVGLKASGNKSTKFVAKYNSDGKCLRANDLFRSRYFDINNIALDYENSLYISGQYSNTDSLYFPDGKIFHSLGEDNSFIAKYDSLGKFIRVKSYIGSNSVRSMITDSIGDVYVAGTYKGQMEIDNDTILSSYQIYEGFIVKYNLDGELLWVKQIGGPYNQDIVKIKVNNKGEIFIFGTWSGTINLGNGASLTTSVQKDVFMAKLNSKWECLWAKGFGSELDDEELTDVEIDKDDNIYLLGTFRSYINLGNRVVINMNGDDYYNRFLVKYKALFVNAPALINPVFDTKNISPNASFAWSAVKDVSSYRVQVSTTNDFSTTIVNEVLSNTTAKYTSLLDSTKYYWRVKGLTDSDSTDWSVTWSFTTGKTADVEEANRNEFSISPQPVKNEAVITFTVIPVHAGITIELYDLKGTLVATHNFASLSEGTNKLRLDVINIPSGMYNVIIKSGSEVHQAKMIKVD